MLRCGRRIHTFPFSVRPCALNLKEKLSFWLTTRWHRACRDCQHHCLVVPRSESAVEHWSPKTWRYEPALLDPLCLYADKWWYLYIVMFLQHTPGEKRSLLLNLQVKGSLAREYKDNDAILLFPIQQMCFLSNAK